MYQAKKMLGATLLGVALYCSLSAPVLAEQPLADKVFGTTYLPVPAVTNEQAQVVYYRTGTRGPNTGAAHVYLDKEFHTGLLPSGFTTFCVKPGMHTLGAYLNDAPLYKGKTTDLYEASLEAGQTYFLKVGPLGSGAPQVVERAEAEKELAANRQQIHVLSRASMAEACRYVQQDGPVYKDYTLSGDVLFDFGKSGYGDISSSGRKAIGELIAQLHRDQVDLNRIQVVGHTDPVGSEAGNQILGLKRANTVRRLLIDGGLPAANLSASSAGSSELIIQGCGYDRVAERNECNAPNRRVVVRVDISKTTAQR
ncbi:OmpA family protein [Pseudomonas fluorescens]|uniref:OmpA family protein n=1 Tax=Pseudomonas fluorescens TaxID=294 RepID=UPI001A9D72F5|nr:OmpA family protein [Pseudomonas fluorescens]QTD31475.1 OmpA family protein [Pseudomonas fluorescens]